MIHLKRFGIGLITLGIFTALIYLLFLKPVIFVVIVACLVAYAIGIILTEC